MGGTPWNILHEKMLAGCLTISARLLIVSLAKQPSLPSRKVGAGGEILSGAPAG